MSTAAKCDRCGKFFEPDVEFRGVSDWHHRLYVVLYRIPSNHDGKRKISADLCGECFQSLADWFDNGMKKGSQDEQQD